MIIIIDFDITIIRISSNFEVKNLQIIIIWAFSHI
jgi:hypothetical protein